MSRANVETRQLRARALRPLFERLEQRGGRRTWLATQLGMSRKRLWAYEHGYERVPVSFVPRACGLVDLPPSLVPIPDPPDLYIQPARKESTRKQKSVKSPATTRKTMRKRQSDGQRNGDGQHRQSATRRRTLTANADTPESSTDQATLNQTTAVDLASGLEESRA